MLFPVFRRPRKRLRLGVRMICLVADIPAAAESIYAAHNMLRNAITLIVDSRDRVGALNYDNFSINVSPAIVGATKAKLLFASVGVPLASTEPWFVVRSPQLGLGVRTANAASGCSFIIPVSSQPGFRSLHTSAGEFSHVNTLTSPSEDISRLDFSILKWNGAAAGLTEDSFYIVELSFD